MLIKFKNFLSHAGSFLSAALPALIALEALPGTVGKVAAVLAGGVSAVLNRAAKPVGGAS
jgi:hypothetical protein